MKPHSLFTGKFALIPMIGLLLVALLCFGCNSEDSTSTSTDDDDSDGDGSDGDLWPDDDDDSGFDDDDDSGDDDDDTSSGCGVLSYPEEVNFGAVLLGQNNTETISLANDGTCAISINAVQILTGGDVFALNDAPEPNSELLPGNSIMFSVTYTPDSGRADSVPLQVANNSSNKPLASILLKSEYKGVSDLVFKDFEDVNLDPLDPTLFFGNVGIDSEVMLPLHVCNEGTDNKVITLSGATLKYGLLQHFTFLMDPNPVNEPVFVVPGECVDANLTYHPAAPTIYPELHEEYVMFAHDADNVFGELTDEDRYQIKMIGTSDESSIAVNPDPIDFGAVVLEDVVVKTVTVTNQAGNEVEILDVTKSGNHCEEFEVFAGDCAMGCTLAVDQSVEMNVSYRPMNTGPDTGCNLTMETDMVGTSKWQRAGIIGSGRNANVFPIARIALYDHGPDVVQPLPVDLGGQYNFFGEISYDEDEGYPLKYQWTLITPQGSYATIWPPEADTEEFITIDSVMVTPDVHGDYMLQLTVKDTEGAVSQPKTVYLQTSQSDKITVEMRFTGSGKMNTQLNWRDPNGSLCSDQVMNSARTCNMAGCGAAIMTAYTSQADQGTREEVVHAEGCDGTYTIETQFLEDCAGWDIGFICLDQNDTDVTVNITVNDDLMPSCTLTGHMSSVGQSLTWSFPRILGEYHFDQLPCQ